MIEIIFDATIEHVIIFCSLVTLQAYRLGDEIRPMTARSSAPISSPRVLRRWPQCHFSEDLTLNHLPLEVLYEFVAFITNLLRYFSWYLNLKIIIIAFRSNMLHTAPFMRAPIFKYVGDASYSSGYGRMASRATQRVFSCRDDFLMSRDAGVARCRSMTRKMPRMSKVMVWPAYAAQATRRWANVG